MPHIHLDDNLPGIRALMAFRPETAEPLSALANILLRNPEGLSMAERELIATHVSYLNDCFYCHHSHGEIACIYLDGDRELVEQVRNNFNKAAISEKMKSLLAIAAKVQQGGKFVTEDDIEKYVGVSKEYNAFELQNAMSKKDLAKAIRIIQYFESNPKAAPIQLVLPALYGFFSKLYSISGMTDKSEAALRPMFYNNPFAVKEAIASLKACNLALPASHNAFNSCRTPFRS